MSDAQMPVDIGLKEFVSTLIDSVFESVLSARHGQEQQLAELDAALSIPEQDYAVGYVRDEDVEALLCEWFPAPDAPNSHRVIAGMNLTWDPKTPGRIVLNDLHGNVEIALSSPDYTGAKKDNTSEGVSLTQAGVSHIYDAARLRIARRQRASMQQVRAQGIPRIVIDAGKINAKLQFMLTRDSVDAAAPPPRPGVMPARPVRPGPARGAAQPPPGNPIPPSASPPVPPPPTAGPIRLMVRTPGPASSQSTDTQLAFQGEVELHFRTL